MTGEIKKYYNEGDEIDIEIFTIEEYKKYKEKYKLNRFILMEDSANYNNINHPHDKSFRKALDIKSEAVWLINKELGEKGKITEEEIEKYNSSFITERFKNLEADVIYKIKNKDIFFLIEHQTKVDYTMPLRILEYEMAIMYSCLNSQKNKKTKQYRYPAVIPIVLYTGKEKWKASSELKKVQQTYKKIKGDNLSKYNIFDNNKYNEEQLLNENTLIAQLILIEKAKNEKILVNNLNKIVKQVRNTSETSYGKEKREILRNVIKVLLKDELGKNKLEEYLKELNIDEEEERYMERVFEMLEKERKKRELKLEKLERAVERSRKQGEQESRQEIAKNMKKEKMPIKLIIKFTGLKEEEIKQLN